MACLAEEILGYWNSNQLGYSRQILSLTDDRWPAWAINLSGGQVGVAVPFESDRQVMESFANVWIRTLLIPNISNTQVLVLFSFESNHAFASLCSEFVAPGEGGAARACLVSNPVSWWLEWKTLLGNKNVEKRVYDVLGELVCLATLDALGLNPGWTGPNGSSTDIDCEYEKYEVKSTTVRGSRTIEIHGLFQLSEDTVPKYLLFVQFEPSVEGISINGMLDLLVERGFSGGNLNGLLSKLGYPDGASARDRCYRLLGLSKYRIDDAFPHIGPSSFVAGALPTGVTQINYEVSLDGLGCENLLSFVPETNR